jgi:cytochrome c2
MAPGTAMGFRLSDAQDRADVIAYLKQQSSPQH